MSFDHLAPSWAPISIENLIDAGDLGSWRLLDETMAGAEYVRRQVASLGGDSHRRNFWRLLAQEVSTAPAVKPPASFWDRSKRAVWFVLHDILTNGLDEASLKQGARDFIEKFWMDDPSKSEALLFWTILLDKPLPVLAGMALAESPLGEYLRDTAPALPYNGERARTRALERARQSGIPLRSSRPKS